MSEKEAGPASGSTTTAPTSAPTQRPSDVAEDMAGAAYLARYPGTGDVALIEGARTGGRLTAVVRELAAGQAASPRRHRGEDLVYVVLDGEVELEVPGRRWVARPLTALHVPPGVGHRYRATTPARLLVLATPAAVEPLLVHEQRLARDDPALLLALAQEHRVDLPVTLT
ncbi:MAG: cupin domain-containing protein [Motilibacteraceae bacterium]